MVAAFDPVYVQRSRVLDAQAQRQALQESLRLVEDHLYESTMSDATRLTLELSAGSLRTRILELPL